MDEDSKEREMSKIVDARDLPCPQPVILTRKALQESQQVVTIVDNETSQHNVTRMAQKGGCQVAVEEQEDGIYLHISQSDSLVEVAVPSTSDNSILPAGPLVLSIPDECMGRGDPELGQVLIRGFFHTLGEIQPLPDIIVFFNSGVNLVVQGSPVLEDIRSLSKRGVEILACGTCLGHYDLKDRVAVGEVSNMYTIAETLLGAGKTISL